MSWDDNADGSQDVEGLPSISLRCVRCRRAVVIDLKPVGYCYALSLVRKDTAFGIARRIDSFCVLCEVCNVK